MAPSGPRESRIVHAVKRRMRMIELIRLMMCLTHGNE